MAPDRAWEILVRTCWLSRPVPDASDDALVAALQLARRNEVEAPFVRAYADKLRDEMAEIDAGIAAYHRNLGEACELLARAGVRPILIKALPDDDYTYTNFDVVVGDDGWDRSVEALRPWAVSTSRYPLERRTKLLLYPPAGPAAHLHREVAWFDIPAIPTADLRAGAAPAQGVDCLLPSDVDALRILLAHAIFQNLALSLGELLTLRRLSEEAAVVAAAQQRAEVEGWGIGFRSAVRTARRTMDRLDRLEYVRLPVPLSIPASVVGGATHALHLLKARDVAASVRELALRGPLVVAKLRAAYR